MGYILNATRRFDLEYIPGVISRADGIICQLPAQNGRVVTVVHPTDGALPQHKGPDEILESFLRPSAIPGIRQRATHYSLVGHR